ncbi:hypothetical protein BJ742DRAFT_779844 [Cladochytrium replicatum]|nr:hypothetical protein BJ742DRAFT_779844 [Cladochytrium replicatum]
MTLAFAESQKQISALSSPPRSIIFPRPSRRLSNTAHCCSSPDFLSPTALSFLSSPLCPTRLSTLPPDSCGAPPILKVPIEILHHILDLVVRDSHLRDLLVFAQTCRYFSLVADSHGLWPRIARDATLALSQVSTRNANCNARHPRSFLQRRKIETEGHYVRAAGGWLKGPLPTWGAADWSSSSTSFKRIVAGYWPRLCHRCFARPASADPPPAITLALESVISHSDLVHVEQRLARSRRAYHRILEPSAALGALWYPSETSCGKIVSLHLCTECIKAAQVARVERVAGALLEQLRKPSDDQRVPDHSATTVNLLDWSVELLLYAEMGVGGPKQLVEKQVRKFVS